MLRISAELNDSQDEEKEETAAADSRPLKKPCQEFRRAWLSVMSRQDFRKTSQKHIFFSVLLLLAPLDRSTKVIL